MTRELVFRIRHVRKIERLASFRQCDPRIAQAFIMFALLGVVFFLRQRCAPGSRFPCGLALASHVVLFSIFSTSRAMVAPGLHCASHSFHDAATLQPPPSPSNRRKPRLSNAVYRWFVWRPVERSLRAFAICSLPSSELLRDPQ